MLRQVFIRNFRIKKNKDKIVGSRCGSFRPAIDALATGIISIDGQIDSEFPLENFQEVFSRAKESNTLKVVLKP